MEEITGRALEELAAQLALRGYRAKVCEGMLVAPLGARDERVIACDVRQFRWGGERGHVLVAVGAEAVSAERAVLVLKQIVPGVVMYGGAMDAGAGAALVLDMAFRAVRTVPGQVRGLVTSRLSAWGLDGVSDDVELIASELVTNAVEHAPGQEEIRVRFVRESHAVLLQVWDSSDTMPVRRLPPGASGEEAAPDAAALDTGHDAFTRGRGLPIVEALSESWGVTPTAPRGKWVWARCSTPRAAADVTVRHVLSLGS